LTAPAGGCGGGDVPNVVEAPAAADILLWSGAGWGCASPADGVAAGAGATDSAGAGGAGACCPAAVAASNVAARSVGSG
jgi:hypothetical protein